MASDRQCADRGNINRMSALMLKWNQNYSRRCMCQTLDNKQHEKMFFIQKKTFFVSYYLIESQVSNQKCYFSVDRKASCQNSVGTRSIRIRRTSLQNEYTSWTLRVSITTQCRGAWSHPAKQQTEQLQSFQTSQDRTFFASMFTFSGRRGGAKVWEEPCSPDTERTDGLMDGWTFRTRPASRRTAPVQTAKPT